MVKFNTDDYNKIERVLYTNLEDSLTQNRYYLDGATPIYLNEQKIVDLSENDELIYYEIANTFSNEPWDGTANTNEDDRESYEETLNWLLVKSINGTYINYTLVITNDTLSDYSNIKSYQNLKQLKDNDFSYTEFNSNSLDNLISEGFDYIFS